MAQEVKLLYGAPHTVANLSGLADGDSIQTNLVDNSADLYIDVIVQLIVDFPNSPPGNGFYAQLWFAASPDTNIWDGTGITGVEGPFTSTDNLYNFFVMGISEQNVVMSKSANFSWGVGYVPPFYSFVVENFSGQAWGPNSALKIVPFKLQAG
jgi:hypothetical protein